MFVYNFQFSLWDSTSKIPTNQIFPRFLSILFMRFAVKKYGGLSVFRKSFNSLYEILGYYSIWNFKSQSLSILFMRFNKTIYARRNTEHFQFSLWDSARAIVNVKLAKLQLSILFMRFNSSGFRLTSASSSTFNSLYEIRGPVAGQMQITISFFQFSLWDSWTEGMFSSAAPVHVLSILFMRFLNYIHSKNRKYNHFQFSLWDSFPIIMICITNKSFNSLYEIQLNMWKYILQIQLTFNSLYEIQTK